MTPNVESMFASKSNHERKPASRHCRHANAAHQDVDLCNDLRRCTSADVSDYRYMDSFAIFFAISGSQRSPFAKSFSLLYRSSSCVSVAYS